MEIYYRYILDMLREQSERYRRQTQQLVIYRPYVWLRQHTGHMYQFDRASGSPGGPLAGDNFFADLCCDEDPRWRDIGIEYDYVTDSWIIGEHGDPDFLIYMHIYARGGRIDNAITDDSARAALTKIYERYALDAMVHALNPQSGRWCALF